MDDLISRTWLLAEYDKRHKGPPGGARKLIEEAPSALGTNLAEVGTDCISRQAAINMCRKPRMRNADCSDFEMEIMMLPSAEPKRGKWSPADSLYHGAPFYYCSECGEKMLDTVMGKPRWNFCPHCGADMRGYEHE